MSLKQFKGKIHLSEKAFFNVPKQFGQTQNNLDWSKTVCQQKINPPFCVSSPDDSFINHGSRLVYDVQLF